MELWQASNAVERFWLIVIGLGSLTAVVCLVLLVLL